ncbi:MAG: hypothetical protein Q7J48_06025 [Nocardioides sp.]|nr:hypothetical protein [Nocardioides sp.]
MNLRSATATAVIGGLVLALLVTVGWLALLGPVTADISDTRETVISAEDRNQVLTAELAALQAQAADLSGTRSVARRLDRLFPPTADQPGLFQALVRAARAAGYAPDDLTSLSPTAPVPLIGGEPMGVATGTGQVLDPASADLAVQAVTLSAEGDYDQARRLLEALETLDRAFLVQSVELSAGQVAGQLTLSITGSTFVAPPVPAPTR